MNLYILLFYGELQNLVFVLFLEIRNGAWIRYYRPMKMDTLITGYSIPYIAVLFIPSLFVNLVCS